MNSVFVRLRLIRFFTLALAFAGSLAAQSNSFTFSNLTVNLATLTNNTYTSTFASGAAGTTAFTGAVSGTGMAALTGTSTRQRLTPDCGDSVQVTFTFAFNSADSITLIASGPGGTSTLALQFNVSGGTGLYAGKGGSGMMYVNVSATGLITGNGTGTLTSQSTPVATILPSGIVPVFSSVPIIQPGSWISIYGSNLASALTQSNGDFQTSLAGVSVTIDNKPGYLWFVSPGQINLQAPDDDAIGCVNVTVTTPNGTVNSQVVVQPAQPSFSLLTDEKHVTALVYSQNGSGAYAGGLYDIVGPTGAFSFATRPVKVGETLVLYGVGFGPTMPSQAAGKIFAGSSPAQYIPTVTIGGKNAPVTYAGLVETGLFQLNVTVPNVPSGDQLIQATSPLPNPILFSAFTTQNCSDPDAQSPPANCAVYVTVQ